MTLIHQSKQKSGCSLKRILTGKDPCDTLTEMLSKLSLRVDVRELPWWSSGLDSTIGGPGSIPGQGT